VLESVLNDLASVSGADPHKEAARLFDVAMPNEME
jgi:hypothetical protein